MNNPRLFPSVSERFYPRNFLFPFIRRVRVTLSPNLSVRVAACFANPCTPRTQGVECNSDSFAQISRVFKAIHSTSSPSSFITSPLLCLLCIYSSSDLFYAFNVPLLSHDLTYKYPLARPTSTFRTFPQRYHLITTFANTATMVTPHSTT